MTFHLRGLEPPPADAAAYRSMLAAANDQQLVATHLQQAIENGESQSAKYRTKKLDRLDKEFESRARGSA